MVKNTTTLAFYGGVDEIGGNKILLQDKGTRVFFDFGMSFSMKKYTFLLFGSGMGLVGLPATGSDKTFLSIIFR